MHRLEEFTKSEMIIVKEHPAVCLALCPTCRKEHASAMSIDLLPDIYWCSGTPTHEDWKEYKKEKGLTNEDIANIIGITADSVKNQTQPNKLLPKWVVSMLYEWKNK